MKDFSVFSQERIDYEFEKASEKVRNFFPNFYEKKVVVNKDVVLKYRSGQSRFARQIMTAMRENQILVIQAGVGIGKTIGYLVPLFFTYQNVKKMNHFVISTSNIGLQQQLLTDINMVSNMLEIPLEVSIAKGINNYACMNRIYYALNNSRTSENDKIIIKNLLDEMKEKNTVDKDEIKQVGEEVWKLIKLKNRGACSNCSYSKSCMYRKITNDVNKANIVVTNHNILAKSLLENRTFVKQSNAFIFDEAHQLENAIRDIQGDTLDIDDVTKSLNYFIDNIISDNFQQDYVSETIKYIGELFSAIRKKESRYYYRNINEYISNIVDCDKLPLYVNGLEDIIDIIIIRLRKIYKLIKSFNYKIDYRTEQIEKWISILNDIKSKNDSKNIYWVNYFAKNKISIGYTNKNVTNVTSKLLEKNVPVIFTSGTLSDSNGTYEYFKNSLSLGSVSVDNHAKNDGQAIPSPYNYKEHSLVYYDKNMTDPNEDHQKYLNDLVIKITELLKITNGRSLILFTSKSDMNYVYQNLNKNDFAFKILVQGSEKSNNQLYSEFENDSKSCLFSTGAWEGLDIKGRSLSNVIITRLPFANDNAIMQYKQRKYKKENDSSIFLNDMLQKLAQGTGRLIRSCKDKGIICCLDSRFSKYNKYIQRILPFVYYTDDLNEVINFSEKNITYQDSPRGQYSRDRIKRLVKKED